MTLTQPWGQNFIKLDAETKHGGCLTAMWAETTIMWERAQPSLLPGGALNNDLQVVKVFFLSLPGNWVWWAP